MFNITIYTPANKALFNSKLSEFTIENTNPDDMAIVCIDDAITHMKRYVFGVYGRTRLVKNEINGIYKSATFFGKKDEISWIQTIGYTDAELFFTSPIHIFQMIEMIKNFEKGGVPFWKIDKEILAYAENYSIKSFANIPIE